MEEKKISIPEIIDEDEDDEEPEPQKPKNGNSRKSLIPCNAAGGMKEYTEFVKEGNFLPMSVLDPFLGIENEVFAEVKTGGTDGGRVDVRASSSIKGWSLKFLFLHFFILSFFKLNHPLQSFFKFSLMITLKLITLKMITEHFDFNKWFNLRMKKCKKK